MKLFNDEQQLVSVIMPTYNYGRFIGKAIESVLKQTYKNLELIIIDNYSDDDTEKIVTSYEDDRIKYSKYRNNGIIAASRNHGIKHSHGEYIAFLDSDDIWLPEKLDVQICHFRDNDVVAVSSKALLIRGDLISRSYFYSKNKYTDYTYREFLFCNCAPCSSTIVRKYILLNLKGFDERKEFQFIEDWELWLRVAQKGKFRVLEEPLLLYRIQSDKKASVAEISKRRFHVLEKHLQFAHITKSEINEAKANIDLSIALHLLRELDHKSQEYFIEALRYSSNFKTKLKIFVGYFFSMIPPGFLRALLFLFYHFRTLTYRKENSKLESIGAIPKQ